MRANLITDERQVTRPAGTYAAHAEGLGDSRFASGTHVLGFSGTAKVKDFIRLVYPFALVKREALFVSYRLVCEQERPVAMQDRGRRIAFGEQLRVRKVA